MIVCQPIGDAVSAADQAGRAAEAGVMGVSHNVYRPLTASAALAPANLIGATAFAASATPDGKFKRPGGWSAPEFYAIVDPRVIQVGDYLVGQAGTFFVGSIERFTRPLVIQCNYTVDISRPAGMTSGLNQAYGGRIDATDAPLVTGWPASLLSGGHSEAGRAMLPGDPKRFAGAICKLPRVPGVTFASGDRIVVEGGDTWVVAGAFLLDLGWRLELAGAEA